MRAVERIWTDFSRYPHEVLIRALSVSNPNELFAAGDAWAQTARALYERAEDVAGHGSMLAAGWTGTAADQYRLMLTDLVDGVRKVGAAAASARDLVYAAAEALAAAWTGMPPVSGEAARRQAVLVMAGLAERYLEVVGELNEAMTSLVPGPVDSGSLPPAQLIFGDGSGAGTAVPARPPLFGRMLPAGLAAAGVALGRPFVPSLLVPRRGTEQDPAYPGLPAAPAPETPVPETPVPETPVPETPVPETPVPETPVPETVMDDKPAEELSALSGGDGAGLGGGGLGGGGLGGGASLPPLPDSGSSSPATHGLAGSPAAAGIAAAAGGGAAALAGGGLRGGTPPMMPMGMMGAGAEAGGTGRRLPPWLVETENVWGEPSAPTSPVIGEDVVGSVWW